jgi:ribosome-binding protein aMBF1 (putative translation factor)
MIRQARHRKGWSQAELAKKLAIKDRITIVDWEMDRVIPRDLESISDALSIPMERLMQAKQAT